MGNPNRRRYLAAALLLALVLTLLVAGVALAEPAAPAGLSPLTIPKVSVGVGQAEKPADAVASLQIVLLLTVLTIAPAILVLTTAFTRIVIVLSFVRTSLGTQQQPPNQVLLGLALFLTFFVMQPTFAQVNEKAIGPYLRQELTQSQALAAGTQPVREFMLKQTREKDLALFVQLAKVPEPKTPADVPTYVIVPAFAISELKTAFQIGFIIFVPFIVIDMVVASTLMSMGMMMLPPMMISLPFKILLFIMVDGWNLVVQSLVSSFR